MGELYQIDFSLDVSIYQQLVDCIRNNIKTGRMPTGTQLPTVRGLSAELGVACGTVKRAYDVLESEGFLAKRQGRGTFVSYVPESGQSRKERAMSAIDHLLDELTAMEFSTTEINIFLRLKLQERAAQQENLKLAIVDDSPELLSQISDQLRTLERVDLFSFSLEEVLSYPYKLEDMDLIAATSRNFSQVAGCFSDRSRLVRVVPELTVASVTALAGLSKGSRIGILCSDALYDCCFSDLGKKAELTSILCPPCPAGQDITAYLKGKNAVLVPDGYARYNSVASSEALQSFSKRGTILLFRCRLDGGSILHLKDRMRDLAERNIPSEHPPIFV